MNDFLIQPLGLLGLLGIPIIILIYLLKSKYVQKPVSSTFIWKRSLKYVKRRIPLSFIFSLLLILQILTVILSSFALARPQIVPFVTKDKIIILDSSASMMSENDEGKSRFELAMEKIRSEAEGASEASRITVIAAGMDAELLIQRGSDKTSVINAIKDYTCELGTPDVEGALSVANNVQSMNPDAEIYLYTDKAYFEADGVEVVDFSKDSDANIAVTGLTDTLMGGKYYFNATISNYGAKRENVWVVFYVDGKEVNRKQLSFEADTKNYVTFASRESLVGSNATFYQISDLKDYESVTVAIETSELDGLKDDNSRTIYATESSKVKILVVSTYVKMIKTDDGTQYEADTANSTFLVTVLRSIGYSLSNKTDIKNDISQVNNGGAIEGYDLYIFDGVMPDVLPDDGAVWFINPPSNPVGTDIQISETADEAVVGYPFYMAPAVNTGTNAYTTLTKNIATGGRKIPIGKFRPMSYDYTKYEQIFTCNNKSLLIAGKENNVRVICWSMDIHDSTIALLIDFPLLIMNMLDYSLPDVVSERSYEIGDTVQFNAPVGATEIEFKYGDTVLDSLSAVDTEFKLDRIGLYSIVVKYADENREADVIMLPTTLPVDESDIMADGDTVVASKDFVDVEVIEEKMEIWPYIVMGILLVLIIEWGVYYRDEF